MISELQSDDWKKYKGCVDTDFQERQVIGTFILLIFLHNLVSTL